MVREEPAARPSEARERLLTTATGIFYASGIHSVGVERIVAEAKVTRATFYRHFPSKEDLVVAYLGGVHQSIQSHADQAISSGLPAADILRGIGQSIAGEIRTPGFRGCAFLNAAAEYPDPAHPVHQAVLAHRKWFLATITDLFAQAGKAQAGKAQAGKAQVGEAAGGAARHFVMLRDGVMAAGYLGDPVLAGVTFLRGINGLLGRPR